MIAITILDLFLCTGRTHSLLSTAVTAAMFRCFINIQKDANELKLTQTAHTNVAIYMCTKFAVSFVYVDTNNSECLWQILYVNHILWYVKGNADNQNLLIAVTNWVERTDFDQVSSLVLFNQNMPKTMTGFSHAPLETTFTLHRGNSAWSPRLFLLPVIIALNFTWLKVILSGDFYRGNAAVPPTWVKPPWDTKI